MTNYAGSSYVIPYSGGVPAGGPGNTLSDAFDNSRPAFELGGIALPGRAALDAKWKTFDPDEVLVGAAIDTRLQMCLLEATGKAVCGKYQNLPIPLVEGDDIQLAVYAQQRASGVWRSPEEIVPTLVQCGLMLADDLEDPDNSGIYLLGSIVQTNPGEPAQVATGLAASQFVTYDSLINPLTSASGIGAFVRIRIRQSLSGGLYTSQVVFEAGQYGADWFMVCDPIERIGVPTCFKHIGFGAWAGDANNTLQMQLDNFVVNVEDFGPGYAGPLGSMQQLGAV